VAIEVVEDLIAGPADDVLARILLHGKEGVVHHADMPSRLDDHDRVGYTVNEVLIIPVTIQTVSSQ
jgi:hypothetical protein